MCEIQRIGFPEIGLDNDESVIQRIIGVIESVDELSHLKIVKSPYHYSFRVAPSNSQYLEPILYEILKLMNMLDIELDMGKSMKKTCTVTFNINIS